jgi:hypothetical protein
MRRDRKHQYFMPYLMRYQNDSVAGEQLKEPCSEYRWTLWSRTGSVDTQSFEPARERGRS